MTQDRLVPGQSGADYWSKDIMGLDAQQKAYRAIPVPVLANEKQKHIDARVELELLVEHLATRNDFKIPPPSFHGLSPEDATAVFLEYAAEVENAPPEEKADAQRSLGGHLKSFGESIRNGLMGGLSKAMGIPGVSQTVSAVSFPGEEITAQLLYNFAKIIPGEQDIERGVREWKQENPNQPWWKEGFLTPAVREKGFGVPMGVHLPMEIILDPLNLIPLGAALKLGKVPLTMARLTGKGHSVRESIEYMKRARNLKKAYINKAEYMDREVAAAVKVAEEFDKAVINGEFVGHRDQFGRLVQDKPRRGPEGHPDDGARFEGGPEGVRDTAAEEADAAWKVSYEAALKDLDITDDVRSLYASIPIEYQKMLNVFGTDFESDLNLLSGLPWRKVIDPVTGKEVFKASIREAPNREGLQQMIFSNDYWAEFGEEGIMAQWALKLLFHTGIRPNEIPLLRWDELENTINSTETRKTLILRHSDKEASQRLLDDEAFTFLKDYRDIKLDYSKWDTEKFQPAFKLPGKAVAKGDKDPFSPVKRLNEMFAEAGNHLDFADFGPGLIDFYSGNGIYTYVLRLSKANAVYTKGGTNNIVNAKDVLGHSSIVNTSIYISLMNHTLNIDALTLLRRLGTQTDEAGEAILKENGEVASLLEDDFINQLSDDLYERFNVVPAHDPDEALEFWQLIDEPNPELATHTRDAKSGYLGGKGKVGEKTKRMKTKLELLGGPTEGPNRLNVFTNLATAGLSRKGYTDPVRIEVQNALNELRMQMLDKAIDRNVEYSPPIFISKIKGQGAKAAQDEITESLTMVEALSVFAVQLITAAGEAQLIKTSKEVMGKSSKKLDQATKDVYSKIGKDAEEQQAMLLSWYEPVLQLKDQYLLKLEESKKLVHGADAKETIQIKIDYNQETSKLNAAFKQMEDALIKRDISTKKQGRSGAYAPKHESLFAIPIFKSLSLMTEKALKGKGKGLSAAARAEKKIFNEMSAEAKDELANSGIGYIISPRRGTKELPNLSASKYEFFRAGMNDHWMITGYIMKDGSYWKVGDKVEDIVHVEAEMLASVHVKDNQFVRARGDKLPQRIPLMNWGQWSVSSARQFSPHMIRGSASGKSGGLTAASVLSAIMNYGGDATRQAGARSMRAMTAPKGEYNTAYTRKRLENNGYLIRMGGEGSSTYYRWSDEIIDLWNQEGGTASGRWGALTADAPPGGRGGDGRPPPGEPGTPTSAPLPEDEWSRVTDEFTWRDEQGNYHPIGKTIILPRGMDQTMRFAGDSFRKTFESFFNRFPSKFRKFTRFFVPQTFAATPAAKLRWKYIFSKGEGQEVSSNIGHMLDQLHDAFGSNRRNGRGTKIRLKGGVGVNPRTGQLNDNGFLENMDYFRYEGVKKSPKNAAVGPVDIHESGQVWGPIAEMEQRFIAFQKADPATWTDKRIIRERQKYNHLEVMQDLTTVLNTSRTDLFRYYELTAEQLKWWDNYHQVGPHLVEMLRKSGFDVDSKNSILGKAAGKFRASFVPSLFLEQSSDIRVGFQAGAGKMGMRPSQMKRHDYYWQIANKMDQGQGVGRIKHDLYNTDPILALQRQAESYYDYVATERFMDEFAKLGIKHTETSTAMKMLERIKEYKASGEELSYGNQMSAQKHFGPKWREMSDEKIARKQKEIIEMSTNWKNLELREAVQKGVMKRHPLHGTALPPEASREFAALFSDEFSKSSAFLTVPSALANTMRVLATGADLGVMLLHGIGGIGMMASPNVFMPMGQRFAWAKGSYNMGRAMWSPKVRTEWYTRTQETRREMQKYGIAFFRSTHIEDLPLPGMFTKGRGRPGLKKPGIKQFERSVELAWTVPERMMNGFGFFLDVSKTEMWKVQSKMIKQHFGAVDNLGNPKEPTPKERQKMEDALNDVAASMNAIHGTLQPAAVGIPSKQRNFESAFLLYAALYRRSSIAVMKNLMSTSKWRRGMALESVTGMLAAGAGIAWAIKSAGLNDDVLTPGSADFMSVKVGGMRVGIGTPFYSFIRMGKDITDQMVDDPGGLLEVNFSDNSLLKWFRSGSSPITSIGIDIGTGQDFIGDPLRDTTGGWEVNKIGDRISRSLMPFWIDTIQDSIWGSKDMPPSAGLAEFFGLRTSPQSAYGRLKTARNVAILIDEDPALMKWKQEQESKDLPIDGDTIPKLLLKQLVERHPALQDLEVEISEDVERRGSYIRKRQDEYINHVRLNRKGRGPEFGEPFGLEMKLKGLEEQFANYEITGKQLRERWETLEAENRGANQQLAETYADVIATFNERRLGDMNTVADQFVFDHWYDRYRQEVTGSAALHDIYGNFDSDEFKRRQQVFEDFMVENYGAASWKYIQDMRTQGKLLPPSLQRLSIARNEQLGEFWDLPDTRFSSEGADLIHHWRGARTREAKAHFKARHPQITRLLRILDKVQDRFRKANPTIDALLVEFYDYSALTPAGRLIEAKRTLAAQSRPTRPEAPTTTYDISPSLAGVGS